MLALGGIQTEGRHSCSIEGSCEAQRFLSLPSWPPASASWPPSLIVHLSRESSVKAESRYGISVEIPAEKECLSGESPDSSLEQTAQDVYWQHRCSAQTLGANVGTSDETQCGFRPYRARLRAQYFYLRQLSRRHRAEPRPFRPGEGH